MAASNATMPSFPPGYLQEYSGGTIQGLAIAFIILEIAFLGLRFVARSIARVKFDYTDVLMILGLVFCLTMNAICLVLLQYAGVGYHVQAVFAEDPEKVVLYSKLLVCIAMVYPPTVVCPRLAMLSLYLQVLTGKPYKWACYGIGILLLLFLVICSIMTGLQCIPLAYIWDKTIPGGHCIDMGTYWAWATFPNIVIDLMMILVPLPTIWSLQIQKSLKIGLFVTFLLGTIGLAAGVARFIVFYQNNPLTDPTWQSGSELSWTIGEIGAYFIAACLPTLRPLVILVLRKRGGKSMTDNSTGLSSSRPRITKTVNISIQSRKPAFDSDYVELMDNPKTGSDTGSGERGDYVS